MSALNFLSAAEMAEQIRARRISPVELTKAHQARIAKLNPLLNALVQTDDERALRDSLAREAEAMRGEIRGPLHGVPISIKSSLDVEGLRCEAGTRLRQGYVASNDAVLVSRLRKAGAIVLGVSNTPELLMAWETDNLLYGKTNNPWDLSRTAGGSSGGEAAAIASGCSAGGVGSDGGGSIRVPAHFCGICGLKPTPGRVPSTGHFPVSAGPFALIGVVGPMARTVGDLQMLLEVIAGADLGDPMSAPVPLRRVTREDLKGMRIGYFEDDGRTPVTPETRAAVSAAADGLRRAGFEVEPFRPSNLEEIRQLWWMFFGTAGGMILDSVTKGREAEISPTLREFLGWVAAEPEHTGQTLLDTWLRRDELRVQFLQQTQRFPILLCPVAAIPAFKHADRSWVIEGKTVKYLDAWSYTEWFNLLGNPGVVFPVAQSSEGLPIGVQIVGRPWEEELVLAVAAELERECGGFRRPKELEIPVSE
jgi:Asp-tRNA(Asn)/Glu-tRNA(Gln) amidotransferase A subunit family amidase